MKDLMKTVCLLLFILIGVMHQTNVKGGALEFEKFEDVLCLAAQGKIKERDYLTNTGEGTKDFIVGSISVLKREKPKKINRNSLCKNSLRQTYKIELEAVKFTSAKRLRICIVGRVGINVTNNKVIFGPESVDENLFPIQELIPGSGGGTTSQDCFFVILEHHFKIKELSRCEVTRLNDFARQIEEIHVSREEKRVKTVIFVPENSLTRLAYTTLGIAAIYSFAKLCSWLYGSCARRT